MDVRDSVPQSADRSVLTASVAYSRIRLRHLTCFVVVAQERTLARAAARLHLSQPAVSKTLAELEDLAGRRLVERGRAGTALTPAGEQFLKYAVDVTQALKSAAEALTGTAPALTPVLRVGALPTAAGGVLVQAIARLHERRPHAGVSVRTGDNPELLTALKSGEIDVAVGRIAEPAMMQGVSFELLYAESLAVVARPQHPLAIAGDKPVSPVALLDYPLVIPGAGTAPRHDVEEFFEAHGVALPPGRTETQSVSVARTLTLLSDAVWITPLYPVKLDLDRRWLRRLNLPVPGGAEPVGILSRSGVAPGELASQLMDTLRELS
ncbi:LysR family transcriptional regulator [Trebonia kvetii]|uniref:LysR family transcriptional regulator n=1 Tax=Trebonia kvetii TaxID=2480626 RepID=A0A6P2C6S9_9ACTN|nr:LysR substrate-binding domain-containing protein [Trebonia kvetii]TVZ06998.1 LysR family transcriptional regulator [Trebonia kvetii]